MQAVTLTHCVQFEFFNPMHFSYNKLKTDLYTAEWIILFHSCFIEASFRPNETKYETYNFAQIFLFIIFHIKKHRDNK